MWERVNWFLNTMPSCSNGMLRWYWELWLIGTMSESDPTLRNLKQIYTFKIRRWKLSYDIFFFLIASFKDKERQFCFSVVQSIVKIPKFCVSICHDLRGPGDLALGGECTPFPSAVFTPTFLLFLTWHSWTFSLGTHQLDPILKCLDELELPGGCPTACRMKDTAFKNSQCSAFWWI